MKSFSTHSEDETIALGRQLAHELPRRGVVLLIGNLGAGKTALSKGILAGLGVASPEEVTSPTFTLIHDYGSAFHIDLYRLDTAKEVAALGLEDLFDLDAMVLIEWGERFPQLMPENRVEIRIEASGDDRRFEVSEAQRDRGGPESAPNRDR